MAQGRDRLRQWIERSRLDQTEASAVIGIHPTQLSHILSGRRRPGLDMAVKIEQATGIVVETWVPFESDTEADRDPVEAAISRIDRS